MIVTSSKHLTSASPRSTSCSPGTGRARSCGADTVRGEGAWPEGQAQPLCRRSRRSARAAGAGRDSSRRRQGPRWGLICDCGRRQAPRLYRLRKIRPHARRVGPLVLNAVHDRVQSVRGVLAGQRSTSGNAKHRIGPSGRSRRSQRRTAPRRGMAPASKPRHRRTAHPDHQPPVSEAFRQLRYLTPPEHLSGRDLADKLSQGMQHIHARRVQALTSGEGTEASR